MKTTVWTLLLAVALVATVATPAWAGQFKHAVYYKVGSHQSPYRVVATQLTKSGNVDLVVGDYLSDNLSILLGNGDGTFQKPLTIAVGAPIGVAVGDFNEDGLADLVVVESGGTGDGAIAVFFGDGQGRFKLFASYQAGVGSDEVAIADFNGDGHLDLAVTNFGFEGNGSSLMTFLGNGHGKFDHRVTYGMGKTSLDGIAAGDLNGDGRADIVVTEFFGGSVAVLLNDGTGKFGKPTIYQAGKGGGEVTDVKIADLRHNGKQDLIAANGSYGMVVLLNKGDGTFEKERSYLYCKKTCQGVEAVTVADFNLDGILDVATSASIGDGSLYYGKGDGTFKSAVPIHNSIGNFQDSGPSIATGDFNHDGAPDLAIPIEYDGKVAILLNTQ